VSDVEPTDYEAPLKMPIHTGTLVMMGVHLIDNADLDPLAEKCARDGRYDFMFSLLPLGSRTRHRFAGKSDRALLSGEVPPLKCRCRIALLAWVTLCCVGVAYRAEAAAYSTPVDKVAATSNDFGFRLLHTLLNASREQPRHLAAGRFTGARDGLQRRQQRNQDGDGANPGCLGLQRRRRECW
jgi:hypothetical protein